MLRASLTYDLDSTKGMLKAGTILEGEEAMRFLAAGLATPVVEDAKVETADAKKTKLETR